MFASRTGTALTVLLATLCLVPSPSLPATAIRSVLPLERIPPTAGQQIQVLFQPGLETIAEELAFKASPLRRGIEESLGFPRGPLIEIVLLNDSALFSRILPDGDLFTGFASPGSHRLVLDVPKLAGSPFGLEETLHHELVHMVLGNNIPREVLPRWLNEGIAQLLTGGVTELLTGAKNNTLRRGTLGNNLIPLRDLSSGFPRDPERLSLAYAQAVSFVTYLDRRFGRDRLRGILEALSRGTHVEIAVQQVTGLPLTEIEQQWQAGIKTPANMAGYLADNIYWILFFLAAILTVWGFVNLKRRMRRIEEEWAREEEDLRQTKSGNGVP